MEAHFSKKIATLLDKNAFLETFGKFHRKLIVKVFRNLKKWGVEMKKFILTFLIFFLAGAAILFFSEFKTRNFVETFIASPDEFDEVVQGITIWGDGTNQAILKPNDDRYDEVLAALRKWEVKKVLFKDMDLNQKVYQLDFVNDAKPMDPYNILINADGIMNIHGREYELVNGSSVEELIEMAK